LSGFSDTDRLIAVELIEERPRARTPEIQQELDVALYDLGEENRFRLLAREKSPAPQGPYRLGIGMAERMLVMEIRTGNGDASQTLHLSLSPLRETIKDYFALCERYFDAVKRLPPSQIEAIDMGRRGIHDEGARTLTERL